MAAVPTACSFRGTIFGGGGGLIVPPKENAVSTAAIWDILACDHHYKGVKPFQKGVSEVNDP